ncbi:unnamed protein product [Cuscuta epithymum]|uniref:Uncharacterized protein n=1 Tax=Cuscuta epithymum TaxID=186058 RepID=A0AAV0FC35_9ASTE|nr:unnamed protein product [Cuscuta epithymum]
MANRLRKMSRERCLEKMARATAADRPPFSYITHFTITTASDRPITHFTITTDRSSSSDRPITSSAETSVGSSISVHTKAQLLSPSHSPHSTSEEAFREAVLYRRFFV